jgi:hypothetical protein
MRDNRTARFHDGTQKTGAALADWSIDGMIENLQHRYKFMSFKNTEDDWVKHSINMPLTSMCITFNNSEYGKRYGVASMDEWNSGNGDSSATDKGNKKQHTVEPKHVQELTMIAEIIKESEMFLETPSQKFTGKEIWAVLPKLKSKVSNSKENTAESEDVEPDNDALLSRIFDNDDDLADNEEPQERDDGNPVEALINEEVDLDDEDVEDGDLDGDLEVEIDPATDSDKITEVTIGQVKKKLHNMKRVPVMKESLEDSFKAGKKKLIKMDYINSRLRARRRTKRERRVLQEALKNFVRKLGNNFLDITKKLKDGKTDSAFKPNYRSLIDNL